MRRALALIVLSLPLAGCVSIVPPTVAATSEGSWSSLPHCPDAPDEDWVLVDGFPVDELESAGIRPDCGDTWPDDDGERFTNVTAFTVTEDQLDALGGALESSGYEALVDDFAPAAAGGPRGYAGARDYYLDGVHEGDFTRVAVEIYANGDDPQTYTAFIDHLSPQTRALAD